MKTVVFILFFLAFAAVAVADDRKIDFTRPIVIDGNPLADDVKCPMPKDSNGNIIRDGKRPCDDLATFGGLLYFVLEAPTRDQTWTDGVKRDDLARGIRNATDWSITADQIDMIKKAAGPALSPQVLGALSKLLGTSETK